MRIDVNKFLLVGPMVQRNRFFERAQELGVAEFVTHKPSLQEPPAAVQNLMEALHILRGMVPVKEIPAHEYSSANVLAQHIVERKHALEGLYERKRILEKEIARIQVFGDFSIQELKQIENQTNRVIQFFFKKQEKDVAAINLPEVIHIGSAYGLDYYVTINKEKTSYEGLTEILIDHSVGELQQDLAKISRDIDEYENDLRTLAHSKKFLQNGLNEALNQYHLNDARDRVQSIMQGSLFAIEAWIPQNKKDVFFKLCDEFDVYAQQVQPDKDDHIPTYLENKGPARLGQDLIGIYDVPSHTDKDPSMWVFAAFGLFFAMIVDDFVYGTILFFLSLFLYYKFAKKSNFVRRVLKLSLWLSVGCMIWGLMTASFAGFEVEIDSPLRTWSPIHWLVKRKAEYLINHQNTPAYEELAKDYPQLKGITDPAKFLASVEQERIGMYKYVIYDKLKDNLMIEIAIFVGTLHIMLSFLRYIGRNWSGLGWIVFMIGGYLYFPSVLKAVSLIHYAFGVPYELGANIGFYLIFIGIGLAAVLAFLQRRWGGLVEVMHVIGVFSDVMSYLRIYALSLAGLIMANTFNNIAGKMPIYIGIIIFLAGHTVNFILALGGGLIHGLRLNFIEWYHYSFEGGGKEFKPLKLLNVD